MTAMADALTKAGVRKKTTHRINGASKPTAPTKRKKRETAKQYTERMDREIAALITSLGR